MQTIRSHVVATRIGAVNVLDNAFGLWTVAVCLLTSAAISLSPCAAQTLPKRVHPAAATGPVESAPPDAQATQLDASLIASTSLLVGRRADGPQDETADSGTVDSGTVEQDEPDVSETRLLSNIRQLTFQGRRAGEGYFSRDGQKMVFQSERADDNPFFQIYLMDFTTGDVQRISPGHGKTTCAWIHPDGDRILYASTQHDPRAIEKQEAELEQRASGNERRYSWDYDPYFDLYEYDLKSERYRNLTKVRGYDAEGSYSPNGQLIAFASNRHAYAETLPQALRDRRQRDPSYFMELYLMRADGEPFDDGQPVRRLTHVAGYDGGPFFSPDGSRLCWRRFSEDGARAEIMTMDIDGSDVKTLTHLSAMSWAPFYHPSGEYLIFATNVHGFSNFELYLIDTEAQHQPVRVTTTDGFDGLPVFTPDGQRLTWTSNRGPTSRSQLFIADWDHQKARSLLGLDQATRDTESLAAGEAQKEAQRAVERTQASFSARDIVRHVDYLCRPELAGRRTGSPGEKLATAYVAAYLDQVGLTPAGTSGNWFQPFEYTSGVSLGTDNQLTMGENQYEVGEDWTPLSFSSTGTFASAPVVFAGYGIAAPENEDQSEYDSFVHLDVADKWILAFRFLPENVSDERRQHLSRHSSLRFKAMLARDKGAHGLILVSGPNSKVKRELVPMKFDGSLSSSSLPILSISDEVADSWLQREGRSLKKLQDQLDSGDPKMGFALNDVLVAARIDIEQQSRQGRNVLGRLVAGATPSEQVVIVGAHIDHLGKGSHSSSLARDDEQQAIHFGADDNASGVAAMLEIAQWMTHLHDQGKLNLKRDIMFAAWSGEEDGLIGSTHFSKNWTGTSTHHQHGSVGDDSHTLYPSVAACFNLDMVGRLEKKLILQGVGSSPVWRRELEQRNAVVGLPLVLQNDGYIPTDASVFFTRGVPILSAFTGAHPQYHTPRDTPDKLNYEGAAQIAQLMALVARSVAAAENAPEFTAQSGPKPERTRARMRAYLGTVPDYAESDVKGVKLSAVAKNGPAAKAGVQGGDLIVELAGRKIENIYDYTYAIEALKIGQPTKITVQRGGKTIKLDIIPESRQ